MYYDFIVNKFDLIIWLTLWSIPTIIIFELLGSSRPIKNINGELGYGYHILVFILVAFSFIYVKEIDDKIETMKKKEENIQLELRKIVTVCYNFGGCKDNKYKEFINWEDVKNGE